MTTPITEGTGKITEDCGIVPDLASLFLFTEPEDGEGTPGGSTPFETSVLSTEAELGLDSASAPCLFLEDKDIQNPECVALPEDHPRPFMEPPVNPAVYVPGPEPILGSKRTKNQTELVSTQTEERETELAILELLRLMAEDPVQSQLESEPLDHLKPAVQVPEPEPVFVSEHTKSQTELVSTQTEEHETELAILELLRLMAEDPVQSALESEPLDRLQKNNQGPGTEELHSSHNFPPSSFEAMENASILPGILSPRQDVAPHFQEQFRFQAPPEPQPFQDLPGPSLPLNLPSTSNYVSTQTCGNAYQLPRLLPVHPPYFRIVPCLAVNWMQSNNQLTPDIFQPSHQLPNGIWHIPYSSYIKTNQSSFILPSSCPQVPQMYNTPLSVSAAHQNLNSLLTSLGEVPHLPSQDFQCNISHEHEQPLVVQSCCNRNNHSQKLYKNYRRWQIFCKVASSVYTSSPDVEALACFFTQVINSITLQCPGIARFEVVKIAVSQWEKLSDFKRMEYYHKAQRFMDYELEEMVCLWPIEATSSRNTPTMRDEPPAMGQATDQKQSSYTAPPDLAKVAPDEYSEKESDDNQDKKVMQDDDKEQDGFCSQIVSQLQLRNRGKGSQISDESIRKNKTSLTEVQEKDAKRSRIRQHGQDMVMTRKGTWTKQEETARQRLATSTTDLQSHEQKDLGQDQQCIGLQSQGLSRLSTRSKKPLKSSLLSLVLPQTGQTEEARTNDGREEMEGSLTRAKRANSDKNLDSLPTKKQKMTSNKKTGFQFDVANLKASSTPSSSERSRWKTRGSPATSREMTAEERAEEVTRVCSSQKHYKTDGKNSGGKRVKAQASQKGLRQRRSDRLATLQKRQRAKLRTQKPS